MRPAWLFVGALAIFALLGLLAGRAPTAPEPQPQVQPPSPAREAHEHPRAIAQRWGRSFAVWSHDTLSRQLEALAATATPGLRTELRRGAQAIRRDESLARDGAGSRGSVRVVRLNGDGERRAVLVVTRETPYVVSGTDLQGARYRVYTGVLVQHASRGWLMQSWERQP